LDVEMTDEFLVRVRKQFNLDANAEVSDDHVRMFVWGAVDNAVKKVEGQ
jgi:uncharacterized protein (DUF2267 family)